MDGQMDGWKDGWMNGQIDEYHTSVRKARCK